MEVRLGCIVRVGLRVEDRLQVASGEGLIRLHALHKLGLLADAGAGERVDVGQRVGDSPVEERGHVPDLRVDAARTGVLQLLLLERKHHGLVDGPAVRVIELSGELVIRRFLVLDALGLRQLGGVELLGVVLRCCTQPRAERARWLGDGGPRGDGLRDGADVGEQFLGSACVVVVVDVLQLDAVGQLHIELANAALSKGLLDVCNGRLGPAVHRVPFVVEASCSHRKLNRLGSQGSFDRFPGLGDPEVVGAVAVAVQVRDGIGHGQRWTTACATCPRSGKPARSLAPAGFG